MIKVEGHAIGHEVHGDPGGAGQLNGIAAMELLLRQRSVTANVLPIRKNKDDPLLRAVFLCGRYWVRTSDLFGVNEALYH